METPESCLHKKLLTLRRSLKSRYLTPLNLKTEETRFLSDPQYEPRFDYEPLPQLEIQSALENLESESIPSSDRLAVYLLSQKIKEALLKAKIILARGSEKITDLSKALYQLNFPDEIIEKAEEDSRLPHPFTTNETASGEDAVKTVARYLRNNMIVDWKVNLTDKHDFFFRVLPKAKTILVSEVVNWDFCDLDNTLAHEIDGHVFRAINMHAQTNPLFQKPLPFYIKTEEGLASFMCDFLSTTAELGRKHHALKYLAGQFAITHSFGETYNFLVERGFTSAIAFRRTFRLKRGIVNGEMPGLYAREAMYYEGMHEVKKFIDKGGDVRRLFAAKASLEDLKHIPLSENIKIPPRIKNYRPFQS